MMFEYTIYSLFKFFVCTTTLYLCTDKNKIQCLSSMGQWGDRHEYTQWQVYSSVCCFGGTWMMSNYAREVGLRRQFLKEQDAWACRTSRNCVWKDLCICELEKVLEMSARAWKSISSWANSIYSSDISSHF